MADSMPPSRQASSVSIADVAMRSWPSSTQRLPPSTPSRQSHSKAIPVSSLMISPVEEPVESFTKESPTVMPTNFQAPKSEPQRPPSPPISPWTRDVNQTTDAAPIDGSRDPILIPDVAPESQAQPLFRSMPDAPAVVQQAVSEHIRTRRRANPTGNHPAAEDYNNFYFFVDEVMKKFLKNPNAWLKRERNFLQEDDMARKAARQAPVQPIRRSPNQPKPLVPRPTSSVVARTDPIRSAIGPRHSTKVEKTKAQRPPRAHPSRPAPERPNHSAPQSARNRQAAATKEDKDFDAIPDYCPPLDSLNSSNALKVEWKGATNALDLSDDPLRDRLHPSELKIASLLRLDCATYLTSKRRIFLSRLEFLHRGKEFRKTHAQQATFIDVNKASKLHTAFDEVGWFEAKWMKNFRPPPSSS